MTNTNAATLAPLTTTEALKIEACQVHADYPQYAGHFDSYRLVRIKRDIRTKFGRVFQANELAIAAPFSKGVEFVTVWSRVSGVDTSVRARDVEAA
jgi:hypothetical protein